MTPQDIANNYQRQRAHDASPVGLVVVLYDGAIEFLRRAKLASQTDNIEARVAASNRVLLIINELARALDHERGGEVAEQLDRFYSTARALLMQANSRSDPAAFDEAIGMFCSVREAWRQVELDVSPQPVAVPAGAHAAEISLGGWSA
jgi:flagellar protein FliS